MNCSSLTGIILPDAITQIAQSTFRGCSSLSSVIIPEAVTQIDYDAFDGCDALADIYSLNVTPPELNKDAFSAYTATLHVKPAGLKAYQEHEYWSRFSRIMADMSSGIDEITTGADGEDADVPALYYNMQGQPVDPHNLRPGQLYIRCQGGKSTKFIAQ